MNLYSVVETGLVTAIAGGSAECVLKHVAPSMLSRVQASLASWLDRPGRPHLVRVLASSLVRREGESCDAGCGASCNACTNSAKSAATVGVKRAAAVRRQTAPVRHSIPAAGRLET